VDSEAVAMDVVSDTSPITNLAAVGHLELLQALYTQILIPQEVRDELVLGGAGNNPGAQEVLTGGWFVVDSVDAQDRDQLASKYHALDIGEAAALALAKARGADLILLDDRAARDAARALGLNHIGVVGVLLAAKSRGLISLVKPILDDLRATAGFYLAEAVYQGALRAAGE
jgi:predicted nucleic acid-binding protein